MFDIVDFSKFEPPYSLCRNCRAVYCGRLTYDHSVAVDYKNFFQDLKYHWNVGRKDNEPDYAGRYTLQFTCQICGAGAGSKLGTIGSPVLVREDKSVLELGLEELAATAANFPPHIPLSEMLHEPLNLLLKMISSAKWFIHFTTYSFDTTMAGALAVVANQGVEVRGIVGKPHAFVAEHVEALMKDDSKFPNLPFLIALEGYNTSSLNPNHSKLIIIDGLVAFSSSANLTVSAWLNASKKSRTENITAITKPEKVVELNNEVFAPLWKQHGKTIEVDPVASLHKVIGALLHEKEVE